MGGVYESFVPGEDCCELGLRRRYSLRSTFSLGGMHHAAKLDRTSQISDGFQRRPQTISSPPPQRKVVAGTKDSARGIGPVRRPRPPAPSAGLRPLIVSRVKCGGGPCRGHSVLPCTGNTICLHCAFIKGARFGICLRKHVVAATGPSPFKVGDNQRPERTMSGVENLRLSVPSPVKN